MRCGGPWGNSNGKRWPSRTVRILLGPPFGYPLPLSRFPGVLPGGGPRPGLSSYLGGGGAPGGHSPAVRVRPREPHPAASSPPYNGGSPLTTATLRPRMRPRMRPMSSAGSVTQWIDLLKGGDHPDAAQQVYNNYFLRLVGFARRRLQNTPRRAADEEDVALRP